MDWTEDWVHPIEWKPIVRPDAYVFDHKYIYDNYIKNDLLYGGFKIVTKELVDELKGE